MKPLFQNTLSLACLGEIDCLLNPGRLPSPRETNFRVQHKVLFAEGYLAWQDEAIHLA